MILIKNTQRSIIINQPQIIQITQIILDQLQYADFDIGIWITTNKTIQKYNREFRHKDKPTDILSFPFHADLKAGQRIVPEGPEDKNLGDIIISAEYVVKDAQKFNVSFEERLKVLIVHGICHLLGYDHITDNDYKKMNRLEQQILNHLKTAQIIS